MYWVPPREEILSAFEADDEEQNLPNTTDQVEEVDQASQLGASTIG